MEPIRAELSYSLCPGLRGNPPIPAASRNHPADRGTCRSSRSPSLKQEHSVHCWAFLFGNTVGKLSTFKWCQLLQPFRLGWCEKRDAQRFPRSFCGFILSSQLQIAETERNLPLLNISSSVSCPSLAYRTPNLKFTEPCKIMCVNKYISRCSFCSKKHWRRTKNHLKITGYLCQSVPPAPPTPADPGERQQSKNLQSLAELKVRIDEPEDVTLYRHRWSDDKESAFH